MIRVGRIIKPHGIHGELIVESFTDFPEERFRTERTLTVEYDGDLPDSLTIQEVREHQGRLIIEFSEISDRNDAEKFRDIWLAIPENDLQETEEGEYYGFEFEGLEVYNQDQQQVGMVDSVLYPIENPVLEIITDDEEVIDFPLSRDLIVDIDQEERFITLYFPDNWQKLKRDQ